MREGPGWEAFWNRRMQGGGCGRRPEAGVGRAALSLDVWAAAGLPGASRLGHTFRHRCIQILGPSAWQAERGLAFSPHSAPPNQVLLGSAQPEPPSMAALSRRPTVSLSPPSPLVRSAPASLPLTPLVPPHPRSSPP